MLPTKQYRYRQFIYSEGKVANEMYIVKSGVVKIIKKSKQGFVELAQIKQNNFFGEVALFREEKHSATAVAENDVELIVINKQMFNSHLESLPQWLETIIRSMADRLHEAMIKLGRYQPASTSKKEDKEHYYDKDVDFKQDIPS